MQGIKISIVSQYFPLNRDEVFYSFVFDEASRLAKKCAEVHVVKSLYGEDLVVDGMHVHNLPRVNLSSIPFFLKSMCDFPLATLLHPLGSFQCYCNYVQTIAKVTKTHEVDLIHAHFACPEGFAAMLAKECVRKPLVVTLHGYDILTEPSIKYGDRLRKDCDERVRRVLKAADRVLAASRAVYNEAVKAGCSRDKLVHVSNGVDLNRFKSKSNHKWVRRKLGIGNKLVVLSVRALVPKNGVEYLVASAPEVVKQCPDVVFVIIGEGPLRPRLMKLANDLGMSKNFVFIGKVPYIDLPDYYAACDVFVIPSIMEAFGLVTVEAMASSKPVIGTNVGGIPDTIENGKNGYLVPPRDPQRLAEKILLLLENSDLREKMGFEGRIMAEERFDVNKRIDSIVTIYSELV